MRDTPTYFPSDSRVRMTSCLPSGAGRFQAAQLSAQTRTWRAITPPSKTIVVSTYATSGHLLINDGAGAVLASRWDPTATSAVRPETPVIDDVYWTLGGDRSWINVSENGTAVYVPGDPSNRHVVWVDRQGRSTQLPGSGEIVTQATLSRDGHRVVYGSTPAHWVLDLRTGARTRLISDVRSWHGGWLPGDARIAVSSNKDGDWDLYTIASTGGEHDAAAQETLRPARAGRRVGRLDHLSRASAGHRIRSVDAGAGRAHHAPGGHAVQRGQRQHFRRWPIRRVRVGRVGPQGGVCDTNLRPGDRVAVSINGGSGPVWSRDGRELFYRAGDDLISVPVQTTSGLVLGERTKLLDLSEYDSGYLHEFDVSADGQRFLVIRTDRESRPTRLDVILNWFDELRKVN